MIENTINNPLNLPQPNLISTGTVRLCGWCGNPFFNDSDDGANISCSNCGTVYNKAGEQVGFINGSEAQKQYFRIANG